MLTSPHSYVDGNYLYRFPHVLGNALVALETAVRSSQPADPNTPARNPAICLVRLSARLSVECQLIRLFSSLCGIGFLSSPEIWVNAALFHENQTLRARRAGVAMKQRISVVGKVLRCITLRKLCIQSPSQVKVELFYCSWFQVKLVSHTAACVA